jgi:hypothetical protein
MTKGSTGAVAGGGALYGPWNLRRVALLLAAGRLVLGVRTGDLPDGDLLACIHGV